MGGFVCFIDSLFAFLFCILMGKDMFINGYVNNSMRAGKKNCLQPCIEPEMLFSVLSPLDID